MPTRIRLQRHGKKNQPFYHIVVADGRVPRDGKFIEKLGTYNPLTNPATIELNVERAAEWIGMGAQPSDTARRILADVKFNEWLKAKENKIANAKSENENKLRNVKKERLEAEKQHNENVAAAVAAKRKAAAEAEAAAKAEAEAANDAPAAEEAPAAE